jgi:glycosyltransferase involved in cell wall biosynthesis
MYELSPNLSIIDFPNFIPAIRFFPGIIRKYIFRLIYDRIQSFSGVSFHVLFSFENSRFFDLDFLPNNVLSIYFQVDENQRFNPERAARSADLVLAINDLIVKQLSRYRDRVHCLSHAFSGKFTDIALKMYSGDLVYCKPLGRLQAYYVGNLEHGFSDVDLIIALVHASKFVDFHFIGPYNSMGKIFQAIGNQSNVIFHGRISSIEIPRCLDSADILFFAYRDDFLSSSHKVMEYLASGKAIVARNLDGYTDCKNLIYSTPKREEYIPLFHEICRNINNANSKLNVNRRIQYAMNNTYASRIKQIEILINELIDE